MVILQVEGMSCGHCAAAVTQALRELDARAQVQVDLAAGTVSVDSFRPATQLCQRLEELGYPAVPKR